MDDLEIILGLNSAPAAAALDDFFDNLKNKSKTATAQLAQDLGKPITAVIELKVEGDKVMLEATNKLSKGVNDIEQAAKLMNGEFGKTKNELKSQLGQLKSLQDNTQKFVGSTKLLTTEWKTVQNLIDQVAKKLKEIEAPKLELDSMAMTAEEAEAYRKKQEEIKNAAIQGIKEQRAAQEEADNAAKTALNERQALLQQAIKTTKTLNGEYGKTPQELRESLKILQEKISTTTKFKDGTRDLTAEFSNLQGKINEVNELLKQTADLPVDTSQHDAAMKALEELQAAREKAQKESEAARAAAAQKQIKDIEAMALKQEELRKLVAAMNGEYGKTPAEMKETLRILKEKLANTKMFKDGTDEVTEEYKELKGVIDTIAEKLKMLGGGKVGGLANDFVGANIAATAFSTAVGILTQKFQQFIQTGSRMEVMFVQLKGFTGSTQAASEAYQRFVEIGKQSPFTASEVGEASKVMMGFGIETNTSIEAVERLTAVAGATGGNLNHMARNLGQINANQKAYTRDLMQFANQGVPIYQELSNVLGVSTDKIRKMTEEGKVGFGAVNQAIKNLTAEGSAYQEIMQDMENTTEAKIEAMISAVQNFAGSFMMMVNEMDQAMGGILSGIFDLMVNIIDGMAGAMKHMADNIKKFAPLIAAVSIAMATLVGLTIGANWAAFIGFLAKTAIGMTLLKVKIAATAVAQATLQALMGNFAVIALAAGAAAAVAAIALGGQADEQERLNDATQEAVNIAPRTIADRAEEAFETGNVTAAVRDLIKEKKKEYDQAREMMDVEKTKAQQIIADQEEILQNLKDSQKERRDEIKRSQKEERAEYKKTKEVIMDRYQREKEEIKTKYDAAIAAIDAELGLLNEQTVHEKALDQIKRNQIHKKLQSRDLTREEYHTLKQQLIDMDRKVEREKLIADKKELQKQRQDELNAAERDKDEAMRKAKELHNQRMQDLLDEEKMMDKAVELQQGFINKLKAKFAEAFSERNQQQASSHEQAMDQMDKLAKSWKTYKDEAIAAIVAVENARAQAAKEADAKIKNNKSATPTVSASGTTMQQAAAALSNINQYDEFGNLRFAGGPVSGGRAYTVNELGKEAFLSAAGRLSMINVPSFGKWRAPSSGTVIPAHLASQLDIPAGGVNINKAAGMNGRGIGSSRPSSVRHGDHFNNTVTIQSSNPTQTANNMMVQLQKIKRNRLGR